jgi:hypothetical protein
LIAIYQPELWLCASPLLVDAALQALLTTGKS